MKRVRWLGISLILVTGCPRPPLPAGGSSEINLGELVMGAAPSCRRREDGALLVRLITDCDVTLGRGRFGADVRQNGKFVDLLAGRTAVSTHDCREFVACEEPFAGLIIGRGELVTVSYQADCRRGGATRGVGRCEW